MVSKKIICFVTHVLRAYLDHYCRIYLSRTKTHTQNKSDKIVFVQTARHGHLKKKRFCDSCFLSLLDHNLSDIYGAPTEKNCTFCEPCFLSLNELKKHGSLNGLFFFSNGKFVRYISRKYPTYLACVFWSDLEYNLFDM